VGVTTIAAAGSVELTFPPTDVPGPAKQGDIGHSVPGGRRLIDKRIKMA